MKATITHTVDVPDSIDDEEYSYASAEEAEAAAMALALKHGHICRRCRTKLTTTHYVLDIKEIYFYGRTEGTDRHPPRAYFREYSRRVDTVQGIGVDKHRTESFWRLAP